MTELLYLRDSYLRECDAVVTAADGQAVALDRTVFYPGGGGQPPDTGDLVWGERRSRVIGLRRDGENVWHALEGSLPLAGCAVRARIEWERRYAMVKCLSSCKS
jgi:misacylated tRNA(Ala) deacylase